MGYSWVFVVFVICWGRVEPVLLCRFGGIGDVPAGLRISVFARVCACVAIVACDCVLVLVEYICGGTLCPCGVHVSVCTYY